MRSTTLAILPTLVLTAAGTGPAVAQTRFFGHVGVATIPCSRRYSVRIQYNSRHPACPLVVRYTAWADRRHVARVVAREHGVRRSRYPYRCIRPRETGHLVSGRSRTLVLHNGHFTLPEARGCRVVVQFSRWVNLIEVKAYSRRMSSSSSAAGHPSSGTFCFYGYHRRRRRWPRPDANHLIAYRHTREQICFRSLIRLPPDRQDDLREPPRSPFSGRWPGPVFPHQPFSRQPNAPRRSPNGQR
jgi:hypothetical protein